MSEKSIQQLVVAYVHDNPTASNEEVAAWVRTVRPGSSTSPASVSSIKSRAGIRTPRALDEESMPVGRRRRRRVRGPRDARGGGAQDRRALLRARAHGRPPRRRRDPLADRQRPARPRQVVHAQGRHRPPRRRRRRRERVRQPRDGLGRRLHLERRPVQGAVRVPRRRRARARRLRRRVPRRGVAEPAEGRARQQQGARRVVAQGVDVAHHGRHPRPLRLPGPRVLHHQHRLRGRHPDRPPRRGALQGPHRPQHVPVPDAAHAPATS
jgi:hypothetical protein